LTVTLGVSHGTLTLGSTTGLTVTGNGSGSVSLSGSIANLNAALASLVSRGVLNFSGGDTLSINASDGSLSAPRPAWRSTSFRRPSRRPTCRPRGANQGQANSLIVKLNLEGNDSDVGKVQDFLNEVAAFFNAGILTQAQANALLGPGNILLLSVTRR
jgi:hypothetical protein